METVRLHRCHHCANADCPNGMYEKRGVVEGGCPHYIWLDPMLRKPVYYGKRRIRKLTSSRVSAENIDFIHNIILPSEPKRYCGYFTRGVHACIEEQLNNFGDEIPIVPKVERTGDFCLVEVKLAILPEVLAKVDSLRDHWDGTPNKTSRSAIINWFITLTREQIMSGVE